MSNYNNLKTSIDANIKQNGNQEITGPILNSVLNQMVNILGTGYQFAGVATIATNPGTPDAKVFYIANGKGTYEKFGSLEVTEDEVVVLYWDSAWHKVATGIASQAKLSELEGRTNEIDSVLFGKHEDIKIPTTWFIRPDGKWGNGTDENKVFVPISAGDTIKCTKDSDTTFYAMLKSIDNKQVGGQPVYASGFDGRQTGSNEVEITNTDGSYLWVYLVNAINQHIFINGVEV